MFDGIKNRYNQFRETEQNLEEVDSRSVEELEQVHQEFKQEIEDNKEEIADEKQELQDVEELIEDHKDIHKRLQAFREERDRLLQNNENVTGREITELVVDWWDHHGDAIEEDLNEVEQDAKELKNLNKEELSFESELENLEQDAHQQIQEVGEFVHGEVQDVKDMRDDTQGIRSEFEKAEKTGRNV